MKESFSEYSVSSCLLLRNGALKNFRRAHLSCGVTGATIAFEATVASGVPGSPLVALATP